MKHTIVITIISAFYCTISYAQPIWEKIAVGDNVTISFPGKPVMNNKQKGLSSFIFKQADSSANYIVAASDLSISIGIDAETLNAEMEKDENWEQAKNAFLATMGSEATLIDEHSTVVKDNRALKLIVNRKNNKGVTNILTVLIFVHGTISYNVIFTSRDGKGNKEMKEKFFDSLEIK